MNKIIELARKIKALSERGDHGEKMAAENRLKAIMKRYNITMEQIDETRREMRKFVLKPDQRKIFHQIAAMVMGANVSLFRGRGVRNGLYLDCSVSEFLEIQALFDFYWDAYQKDLRLFQKAFIFKNNLYPEDEASEDANAPQPSQEEVIRILQMTQGINKRQYRKQLAD